MGKKLERERYINRGEGGKKKERKKRECVRESKIEIQSKREREEREGGRKEERRESV